MCDSHLPNMQTIRLGGGADEAYKAGLCCSDPNSSCRNQLRVLLSAHYRIVRDPREIWQCAEGLAGGALYFRQMRRVFSIGETY